MCYRPFDKHFFLTMITMITGIAIAKKTVRIKGKDVKKFIGQMKLKLTQRKGYCSSYSCIEKKQGTADVHIGKHIHLIYHLYLIKFIGLKHCSPYCVSLSYDNNKQQ